MTTRDVQLQDADGNNICPVVDYNKVSNQPQINGITLTGNKSSTDLGIFLPDGYTITVATDGSGDFTDIQSALDSLYGKVCAGDVIIDVKAGTYSIGTTALVLPKCLCNILVIQGHSKTDTTISCNWTGITWTGVIEVNNNQSYNLYMSNLKFANTGTKQNGTMCLQLMKCSTRLYNLAFDNFTICYRCYSGGHTIIGGTNTLTNCTTPILVNQGVVDMTYGVRFDCSTTVTTLISMNSGGLVTMNSCKYSGAVTNVTNQTIGQATTNGLIMGAITGA